MSSSNEIFIKEETARLLDYIATAKHIDSNEIISLAGGDVKSFRSFVNESGLADDPAAKHILQLLESEEITFEKSVVSDKSYSDKTIEFQRIIIEKWKEHFARGFDEILDDFSPKIERDQLTKTPDAIKDIVNTVKEHLNASGDRNGEASLLIRDPREDRLVLTYSTFSNLNIGTADSKHVKDPANYFNESLISYVYPLHDSLVDAQQRCSGTSKRSRGLTGWVAVSGHHLLVNGDYSDIDLSSISESRPETLAMCNIYGQPICGQHVSEVASTLGKPRYIGVPVKSSLDPYCTVGVLRYTCPQTGAALHHDDVIFISELAQIIGAILGLEETTTRMFRESLFPYEVKTFRRTFDFLRFLRYMALSLRSSIASLYIEIGDISSSKASKLRLVDAYGIRGAVGSLRDKIKDYSEGDIGFTRWLYDQQDQEPRVLDSVQTHMMWAAKNIEEFYRHHFEKLEQKGTTERAIEIARKYKFKIVGVPVVFRGDKVGVLKVELPSRFDDARHYKKHDLVFLKQCAAEIGPVLAAFRGLLKGEIADLRKPVTSLAGFHTVINVTRMAVQLFRTRLVSPSEAEICWQTLTDYFRANPEQVTEEMADILNQLPLEDKKVVKDVTEWVKKVDERAIVEILARVLTGG